MRGSSLTEAWGNEADVRVERGVPKAQRCPTNDDEWRRHTELGQGCLDPKSWVSNHKDVTVRRGSVAL